MLTNSFQQSQELNNFLETLKELVYNFFTDEESQEIEKLALRCLETQFKVVVVGEFNRGKSTLINALLGSDVLPTAVRETTDIISILRFGEEPRLHVEFKDGRICDFSVNKETLNTFSALSGKDTTPVKTLLLDYPCEILKNEITIVDTPGVNDMRCQRNEITYGYLPNADCVIYVLDATAPLKKTEFSFLQEYIIKNSIPSFVIVLNKVDAIHQEDRSSLIENVKNKLTPLGLSESLNIFTLSSKWALNGIMLGDKNMFDRSGMEYFSHWLQNELKDSRKNQIKIEWIIKILSKFIDNLIVKLNTKLDIEQLELDELEAIHAELMKCRSSLDDKFEELRNYIHQDKDALLEKLSKTITKRYNECFFQIRLEIDALKSDVNSYASNVLPQRLNSVVKNWIDTNSTHIDEYIRFSISNIRNYFLSNFSFTLFLQSNGKIRFQADHGLGQNLFDPESHQADKISKISFGIGTFLAGSLLAVATGGIGLTILLPSIGSGNFLANKFIQPYLMNKLASAQKNDLLIRLPSLKEDVLYSIKESLKNSCDEFYENLTIEIESEYKKAYLSSLAEIEIRLNQFDKDKIEVTNRFDVYCELQSTLQQKLETIKDHQRWI